MLFENQDSKCPGCKGSLTLLSHVKRWDKPREVHEFDFRCNTCKRDYTLKEGEFATKTHERDLIAEGEGKTRAEMKDVINRRCSQCGGPITNESGFSLSCEWCYQEYSMNDGELQPKPPSQDQVKPSMRELHAIHG